MSGRTIPASVIEVAAELVGLFDRERELALALNEARDRLQARNDRVNFRTRLPKLRPRRRDGL